MMTELNENVRRLVSLWRRAARASVMSRARDESSVVALRRAASLASHLATTSPRRAATAASPRPPAVVRSPEEFEAVVGVALGPGPWHLVTQAVVDAFSDTTGDHQFIHKAGAETMFGGPIAHGLLTLSLLPTLLKGVLPRHEWMGQELNCGFNRVRFLSPVPVGSRIRATAKVIKVKRIGGGSGGGGEGVESIVAVEVHGDGGDDGERKPALVAEWVTRQYAK